MQETNLSFLESFAINVLKRGEIPKHIAFIMDGNRRYADKNHLLKSIGHVHGFNKLMQTLEWCKQIGVSEATVYAFSIENFNRSEEEVNALMTLAREKFSELLSEKNELEKNGVCVRFFGSLHLLPKDIQILMAKLVLETRHNNKAYFNVCIAYTSRQEITEAMNKIADAVSSHSISVDDIDEKLLENCLYTNRSPDPDLIVRTSGEVRLSDFLLWQSSFSVLAFVDVLWPTFSFWDFCYTIFYYQRHHKTVSKAKLEQENFQKQNQTIDVDDNCNDELCVRNCKTHHSKKICEFLVSLENKELQRITELIEPVL